MARNHGEYKPTKRQQLQKLVCQTIFDRAASHVSKENIAVELGLTDSEFEDLLLSKVADQLVYLDAFRRGKAKFETDAIYELEDLLDDPATPIAQKVKILQTKQKVLANWAQATSKITITHEAVGIDLDFVSYTEEESAAIAAEAAANDRTEEPEEDSNSED